MWNYTGLAPQDMADRIVSITERALTTTVNDIEHIESQSLNGVAVVKIFFQPNANIQMAIAQLTAISQTQLRQLARRHHAAADHHVFSVERADPADRLEQQQALRAGTERSSG